MDAEKSMSSQSGDLFSGLTDAARRAYVAKLIGCNPMASAGWPNRIIDDLVALRLREGRNAFYERIGTLLARD